MLESNMLESIIAKAFDDVGYLQINGLESWKKNPKNIKTMKLLIEQFQPSLCNHHSAGQNERVRDLDCWLVH